MQSAEFILGVAVIVGALSLFWFCRPSASSFIRNVAAHPLIEPYFPVIIMALVVVGAIVTALALGVDVGAT